MENLDVTDIRVNNKRLILDILRFEKSGLTRKEIARETGLSFATVSNLCNEMIKDNLLLSEKDSKVAVGRSPRFLVLNLEKYQTVCINIQMKGVLYLALLDLQNKEIQHELYDISHLNEPKEIFAFAKSVFDRDFSCSGCIAGVGVAVSGIFDTVTEKIVNCAVDIFEGVSIKTLVEQEFQSPCYVDNEANLCAIGLGLRDANSHVLYIHISEGLGVGVIIGGRLLRGSHGYGGEVAYIPIGDDDCTENVMTIEQYLSVPGILQLYAKKENGGKKMLENWKQFCDDSYSYLPGACRLIKDIGRRLGNLVSLLINIFDSEEVYIGGEISCIYSLIEPEMMRIVNKKCFCYGNRCVKVCCDNQSTMTMNKGMAESIYRIFNFG